MNVGSSELTRNAVSEDGWMLDIDWRRRVAARSNFGLAVHRGFSDAGQLFEFDQSFGGGRSASDYVAAVSNPLEQTRVSVVFGVERTRASAELGLNWSRED